METHRLQKTLNDIGSRVEILREQAFLMQKERESLLELLQNLQDNTDVANLQEVDREDFDWQLERLIIRCLTVDVSVATPRNDIQEESYKKTDNMIEKLKTDMKKDPCESEKHIESYLNASLPEPLSSNINQKFQEKLLECTIDDQKSFRKKLQEMYIEVKKVTGPVADNSESHNYSDSSSDNTFSTAESESLEKQSTPTVDNTTENDETESENNDDKINVNDTNDDYIDQKGDTT